MANIWREHFQFNSGKQAKKKEAIKNSKRMSRILSEKAYFCDNKNGK